MIKTKRIAMRIGIILMLLAVLPVMVAAEINVSYFDPQHSSAEAGDYDAVTMYFNLTDGTELRSAQIQLQFDPALADIPEGYCMKGCPPAAEGEHCWETASWNHDWTHNGYMWMVINRPQVAVWKTFPPPGHWEYEYCEYFTGPMKIKMCDMYVVANGTPGVSRFDVGFEQFPDGCPDCQKTKFSCFGARDFTPINGTFTHIGQPELFEKGLVKDWNLISLPLTASDMTVASVFASVSGNYSAVHRYDAETKHFMALNGTNVLEYGVGYFIYMTSADTWTYEGTAYSSMSVDLEQGLNMVGWLNGTKDIEDALSSIEGKYRYAARWNSTTDKFEVYVPNAPAEFNDFNTMEQGRSYFVSMKVDGETLSENR